MAVRTRAQVARLRADLRKIDCASVLRWLATDKGFSAGLDHVLLANLGALVDPGPAVRRHVEYRRAHPKDEPLTEEGERAAAAMASATSEELLWFFAGGLWDYYHGPDIAECFGLPGGEERLLEWIRERLDQPDLQASDASAVIRAGTERLWKELQQRAERAAAGEESKTN